MIRQVVMHTWADGASEDDKEAFRRCLAALPARIPEIADLRFGDDLGLHADNFDFVTVIDYEDLAACRRYVEHPAHQAFVAGFAKPLCARRAVLQHEWAPASDPAAIVGVHHVKFPVTDVARSRGWYERVFGLQVRREFEEDGVLRGVAYTLPGCDVAIAIREAPREAAGLAGFDPVAFLVEDRASLEAWADRLDGLGIGHTAVVAGSSGWLLEFQDPDGLHIRLYTRAQHGPA